MWLPSLAAAAFLALSSTATPTDDVALVGATLIDVEQAGTSSHDRPNAVILMRHGVIVEVGDRGQVVVPRGARVIDATGSYVVPGLIDGFGSVRSQGFADAYLYEGVTTVYVTQAPAGQDGESGIADVAAGPRLLRGATISGYSADGATPTTHPWTEHRIKDRHRSGAELVGAVDHFADQGVHGLLITLDVLPDQFDVIVAAARRRGLATTAEPAFTTYPDAIHAGVGALLRSDHYLTALAPEQDRLAFADDPTGKGAGLAVRAVCSVALDTPALTELGRQLRASPTALMPVLTIEATADDVGAANPWLSRSSRFVTASELDDPVDAKTGARPYLESHPDRRQALQACAIHRREIDGRLHRQGARYLAGSGAPAYGIMPGGGLHQELRLLQSIGLTPREALAAATSNFADAFGWRDVGRIEAGRAGDLLVVGSDPRLDVAALDDIRIVVHDGRIVDREALFAAAAGARGPS
jgi:Amidohydrolase family